MVDTSWRRSSLALPVRPFLVFVRRNTVSWRQLNAYLFLQSVFGLGMYDHLTRSIASLSRRRLHTPPGRNLSSSTTDDRHKDLRTRAAVHIADCFHYAPGDSAVAAIGKETKSGSDDCTFCWPAVKALPHLARQDPLRSICASLTITGLRSWTASNPPFTASSAEL